jgi:hypothetical protein
LDYKSISKFKIVQISENKDRENKKEKTLKKPLPESAQQGVLRAGRP